MWKNKVKFELLSLYTLTKNLRHLSTAHSSYLLPYSKCKTVLWTVWMYKRFSTLKCLKYKGGISKASQWNSISSISFEMMHKNNLEVDVQKKNKILRKKKCGHSSKRGFWTWTKFHQLKTGYHHSISRKKRGICTDQSAFLRATDRHSLRLCGWL